MINYLYLLMRSATLTVALGTLNMMASALGQNLLWGRISDRYKLRTKLIMTGESIAGFAYIIVFITHKSLIQTGEPFLAGFNNFWFINFRVLLVNVRRWMGDTAN